MGKIKLVYRDGEVTKVLWGKILSEDNLFISFLTQDGNTFRINKQMVISIRDYSGGENGCQNL